MRNKWISLLVLLLAMVVLLPACAKKDEEERFSYMDLDLDEYIQLGDYKGFAFSYEMEKVTEQDVEDYIKYVLTDFGEYKDYENVPEDQVTVENDYILVDFIGYMDGKTSSNTTATDQVVTLDKENSGYIPGFIDDLFGVTVGTTVETDCVFPEDYDHEDYAGKEITFFIKVKAIVGHYYPAELTDELVAENTDFKTAEEYRTYLFEALTENAKATASENLNNDVWTALEECATVLKYPEEQVQEYYDSYMATITEYAAEANYEDIEEFLEKELKLTTEDVMADARIAVLDNMILFAIVQAEGLEATDEEYDQLVADVAEQNEVSGEEIEEYYGREYLIECILYNKALELVHENTDVQYTEK